MSPLPVLAPASYPRDRGELPERLSRWLRVREFAVPAGMIDTATTRRQVGDWAGACAAAHVDVDLDLRAAARRYGGELAARVRADLRRLAPDLLRWHLPRIAPDGLLRPGLTMALARYEYENHDGGTDSVQLVVRTAPAWADYGQRISLALWDGTGAGAHPHPRPDRRFRLDLHRHLWDARRTGELRTRSSAGEFDSATDPGLPESVPRDCAVDRWADEAAILLRAEQSATGSFVVRYGTRRHLVLELGPGRDGAAPSALRVAENCARATLSALPVLPEAATWALPDLALLRAGAITADRLHPLVAAALAPGGAPNGPAASATGQRFVDCRGERHRIGVVDGVLVALDHDPGEIRREELLVALTGTPLPCLRVIDETHRRPDWLAEVRHRLDHGDTDGALDLVESVLGRDAPLRAGPLLNTLEAAVRQRITYGLYRAGLPAPGRGRVRPVRPARGEHRAHPRHATTR